ncbi:MAG: hypothetical protein IJN70_00825 [Clostridia bacterium]|nr:hypothetical protein [Clostridia bacterium]
MKICNTCGFECENETEICPTCGRNCDGSDSPKSAAAQTDPFAEYRKQIDMQMKEQEQRIEAIKKQINEEKSKEKRKPRAQDKKPEKNTWDKTELFSAEEVKEYRLTAVLIYLLGIFGIILALVADRNSPYLKFHIAEELKITVVTAALAIFSVLLAFTFIVPVLCTAGIAACSVINLISACKTLNGKSENAVIIRNLTILN